MAKVSGPLAPRKAIGDALRAARERAGVGLEAVSEARLISTSKLSRIETGQGLPKPRDVRDLAEYYELDADQTARLMRWAAAANTKGWWLAYEDYLEEDLDAHASYESDAATERAYTIPVLPALLQTREYAENLIRSYDPNISDEALRAKVEFRLKRQELLRNRPNRKPLHLRAVAHQCSLDQIVGNPRVMRKQMEHLSVAIDDENIRFQVLPYSTPPLFSSGCMYAIFAFDDMFSGNIVTVENHAAMWFITKSTETLQYRDYFDALARSSTDYATTKQLLADMKERWLREEEKSVQG